MRELSASVKFLSVVTFLAFVGATIAPPASDEPNTADTDARIERIINGLLPAASVKGQTVPRMALAERMKYYNTPEVSIAFFRDGRVNWARGYGLADKTMSKPVTAETLFQAASISKSVTAFARLLSFVRILLARSLPAHQSNSRIRYSTHRDLLRSACATALDTAKIRFPLLRRAFLAQYSSVSSG